MKIRRIYFYIPIIILLTRCAIQPPPSTERYQPRQLSAEIPDIRIGLAEGLDKIEFESSGKIEIFEKDRLIASDVSWDHNWQVQIVNSKPAKIIYRLYYKEVNDTQVAARIYDSLRDRDLPVIVEKKKSRVFKKGQLSTVTTYMILLEPEFASETEAYQYQWKIRDKITAVAKPYIKTSPTGEIILKNLKSGQNFKVSKYLKIKADLFTIKLPTAEGYHFESVEVRKYRNQINFIIDRFGKLTVVNVTPLESYLKGVVGSEMQEKFPIEALKAQAVAARCYTLARIGKQHELSPFDLCDEVHCHVYGGVERETDNISRAVTETRGIVLKYENKICDTFYAGVCGGHSENNEFVWDGEPRVYLQGRIDADMKNFPVDFLKNEENVRRWIESSPLVFCNTQNIEVPVFLEYTQKYFRWQVRYTQQEISRVIRNKTGKNIGRLLEIIPVIRGVSGRLVEIKLRGTRDTITIEKELSIRKALSENYLYSSCFVVDRQGTDFIIKGAGWGHGVGMCQTGAARMAMQGKSYQQILNHYYNQAKIVKVY